MSLANYKIFVDKHYGPPPPPPGAGAAGTAA